MCSSFAQPQYTDINVSWKSHPLVQCNTAEYSPTLVTPWKGIIPGPVRLEGTKTIITTRPQYHSTELFMVHNDMVMIPAVISWGWSRLLGFQGEGYDSCSQGS